MDLLPEEVFDLRLWLSGAVDFGEMLWLAVKRQAVRGGLVERLRKNLADFNEKCLQKSRILYQDVTCNQSILTILVQILEKFSR